MKICTKCQIPQPLENFGKNKNKKDGKNCQCKLCCKQWRENNKEQISLRTKRWREENVEKLILYREDNKEQISLKHKQWREQNKETISSKKKQWKEENREEITSKNKQWRKKNKEIISLKYKQWREQNREVIVLKVKQWYENNKERLKQYNQTPKRKLSIKNANYKRRTITKQGDVTTEQLEYLLDNSTHCFYCNNPLVLNEIHIDHYIPLARGGLHTITNLRVSCKKCNLQKSNKMPEEFLKILSYNYTTKEVLPCLSSVEKKF